MPFASDDPGSYMLRHLGQIAMGKCSITHEEILAFHEKGDELTAEILAGLLYLHEDLRHREEALRAAKQRLEEVLSSLTEQNRELSESRAALAALADALSTPIIKVGRGILLAPIIGSLDDTRAASTTERILVAVSREQARVLILDVTGLSRIDGRSAALFGRVIGAVRLLGTRTIVAGVQPEVAQAIVKLGADASLGGIVIVRNVYEAMRRSE